MTVDAETERHRVRGVKSGQQRLQRWNFKASRRREVERVQQQENVLFSAELLQRDGAAEVVFEREVWGLGSRFNHPEDATWR